MVLGTRGLGKTGSCCKSGSGPNLGSKLEPQLLHALPLPLHLISLGPLLPHFPLAKHLCPHSLKLHSLFPSFHSLLSLCPPLTPPPCPLSASRIHFHSILGHGAQPQPSITATVLSPHCSHRTVLGLCSMPEAAPCMKPVGVRARVSGEKGRGKGRGRKVAEAVGQRA